MDQTSGSSNTGPDPAAGAPDFPREQSRPVQAGPEEAPADMTARPQPSTDPTLDEHQRPGITGGTWIALILGALILVLLLIFILQNNVPANFAYFGLDFSLPLGIAMLFAAIAGVLIMALFGSVRLFKLGHRVRRLEKEREAIKRTTG